METNLWGYNKKKQLLPLFDTTYQGVWEWIFGQRCVQEVGHFIAQGSPFQKKHGIYGKRTGTLHFV